MISFQNFSFRYEESKDFTLRGIDMTVQTGEFILLTGRSGCGKTTLIRSLNGLIPHFYPGEIQGDLLMDGHSLLEMKPSELAGQVGTVFQDPRSQFFMTDTTRELAFGCENLGLSREETIDRIAKAAKELELVDYLNRSIFALSSGEKQQIAIGSVYALGPKVYIFDEPSANLDYAATKRLAEIMGKLKHAGYTIFVVEHRFYYLRDLIDRAFLIQNGKIEHEFTREQFCSLPEETRISYGLRTAYPERDAEHYQEKPHTKDETHRLNVHNLGFAYKKGPDIFQNVSFEAHAGDVIGILGHNGAGKTTLLSILTGLLKQQRGEVCFDGKKLTPRQRRSLSYLVISNKYIKDLVRAINDNSEKEKINLINQIENDAQEAFKLYELVRKSNVGIAGHVSEIYMCINVANAIKRVLEESGESFSNYLLQSDGDWVMKYVDRATDLWEEVKKIAPETNSEELEQLEIRIKQLTSDLEGTINPTIILTINDNFRNGLFCKI